MANTGNAGSDVMQPAGGAGARRAPSGAASAPQNSFEAGDISAPSRAEVAAAMRRTEDSRRFAPRSPRAALEPERVPVPTRWSKSARHPLVIAGNAVFTGLILLALVAGVAFAVLKHRYDA